MPSVAISRGSFTPDFPAPNPLDPQENAGIPHPGQVVDLYLPTQPEVGKRPRAKLRRVRVERVRDLAVEPLSIAEYLETPMLCFGRFIVIGRDVKTKLGVWAPLDWQQPRELAVYHSDGEPAGFTSGRTRFQRLCFVDTCEELRVERGFLVGLKDFPPPFGGGDDDWDDSDVVSLTSAFA